MVPKRTENLRNLPACVNRGDPEPTTNIIRNIVMLAGTKHRGEHRDARRASAAGLSRGRWGGRRGCCRQRTRRSARGDRPSRRPSPTSARSYGGCLRSPTVGSRSCCCIGGSRRRIDLPLDVKVARVEVHRGPLLGRPLQTYSVEKLPGNSVRLSYVDGNRLTGAHRDDGSARRQSGQALLLLQSRRSRAAQSPAARHRSLLRPRRAAPPPRAVLQPHGPPVDRSRADDPHADRRLLLRHSVRAAAVRRGPPEPGLSLVLPARSGGRRSPTTRPSPRTGTAASARATPSATCSRACCGAA